jgi:lysozyme family protein
VLDSARRQRLAPPSGSSDSERGPAQRKENGPAVARLERVPPSGGGERTTAERQADEIGARAADDLDGLDVGPGPLPEGVRSVAEHYLGVDLSGTTLDDDAAAQGDTDSRGALASTQGSAVSFAGGQLGTRSHRGRVLLGHELTHVAQQNVSGREAVQLQKGSGSSVEADPAFNAFWSKIVGFEGTLADWLKNPANQFDRGGKTNFGITFNTFKAYHGAAGLDATEDAFAKMSAQQAMLLGRAVWRTSKADRLRNPGVAVVVGDWFWGSNVAAWGRIKSALTNMGFAVNPSRGLDDGTIALMNSLPPRELIEAISFGRFKHHQDIVEQDPNQKKFFEGWQRRTEERREQGLAIAGEDVEPGKHGEAAPQPGTPEHRASLHVGVIAAMQSFNYARAATLLNGFNAEDLRAHLATFSVDDIVAIHAASLGAPGVGPDSQIARVTRYPFLVRRYGIAVANHDWPNAALFLNGFSASDIRGFLAQRSPDDVHAMHEAALSHPGLGPGSNVAQMTGR